MLIKPFISNKDEDQFKILLARNNMRLSLLEDLPAFGLAAFEDGELIAYGAMRCLEGNRALLDSYITNPNSSKELRNRALDLITWKLIRIATDNKLKQLIAFSKEDNIIIRSLNHGFKSLDYKMTLLNLT